MQMGRCHLRAAKNAPGRYEMGALLSVLKSSGNTNEEPPYHINHVDLEGKR